MNNLFCLLFEFVTISNLYFIPVEISDSEAYCELFQMKNYPDFKKEGFTPTEPSAPQTEPSAPQTAPPLAYQANEPQFVSQVVPQIVPQTLPRSRSEPRSTMKGLKHMKRMTIASLVIACLIFLFGCISLGVSTSSSCKSCA